MFSRVNVCLSLFSFSRPEPYQMLHTHSQGETSNEMAPPESQQSPAINFNQSATLFTKPLVNFSTIKT